MTSGFQVTSLSTPQDAVWQLNRPIEFGFSFPVDFSTVSSNTINIVSSDGVPATGSFRFRRIDTDGDGIAETTDEHTIVFQPNCPTRADFQDAGFTPGGVEYTITIVGRSTGTNNTLRSSDGRPLEVTQSRSFSTPNSLDSSVLFLDVTAGAPLPVVRTVGAVGISEDVTYIEVGNDPDPNTRMFFEFDPVSQTYSLAPGSAAPDEVPLNLYADEGSRVAVLIAFNQPVDVSPTNLSERRLRLEFEDGMGDWIPVETRVELVSNCTDTGANVRLEPVGLLPTESRFRAVVLPGFRDLVGEAVSIGIDEFAVAPTATLEFLGLTDPSAGADEFFEPFDFGGEGQASFEDTNAVFDTPAASWENGRLSAAFDFTGEGGPGGDFDWVIREGQTLVFDTANTTIVGGPNGIATTTQEAVNGIVDVRNLIVREGATLRIQGPNTLLVNATGDVIIDGDIDASGFNAKDVATLNTGQQPEIGGAGAAGGGRGGDASQVVTDSTPRGGPGFGPFGEPGTGGQGGESGYAGFNLGKDARRPGGGGGGRFAADFSIDVAGQFAQQGFPGHPESRGAETNALPALGGVPGRGIFQDGDPSNDFWGIQPIVEDDGAGGFELTGLVRGELTRIWAGYGGGGGGDALPSTSFPSPRWNAGSDEKGGGGGGAGGGIRIRALGEISFGRRGRILSEGGHGGTGENTNFLDHVGGTGGSGSGGHVVLESALRIDLTGRNPLNSDGDPLNDDATSIRVRISTRGHPFYIGSKNNRDDVPCGVSHGGGGGPGIIQLHVPSLAPPTSDSSVSDILISDSSLANPGTFGSMWTFTRPPAIQLIPTFGARSKARSRWISIGGADVDTSGTVKDLEFLFDGIETTPGPDFGKVLTMNNGVQELAPLVGPEVLPSGTIAVLSDELTMRITGASLTPLLAPGSDLFLRTPSLLRNFLVRLNETGNISNQRVYDVAGASFDDVAQALTVTVSPAGESIQEFIDATPSVEMTLVPRYFQVRTDGIVDRLPDTGFVRITFDGAGANGLGEPDESALLVDHGSVSDFNALPPGQLKFFRFEVEFNLDALASGVNPETAPILLDFLRVPFRF